MPAGLSKDYFQDLRGKADVQAQPEKTLTMREENGQYETYKLTVEEAEKEEPVVSRESRRLGAVRERERLLLGYGHPDPEEELA